MSWLDAIGQWTQEQGSRLGYQASRLGNQYRTSIMGYEPNWNADEYDMWGVKKQQAPTTAPAMSPAMSAKPMSYDPTKPVWWNPATKMLENIPGAPSMAPAPKRSLNLPGMQGSTYSDPTPQRNPAGLEEAMKKISDSMAARQQRYDDLYNRINGQGNPYSWDNPMYQKGLRGATQNMSRQYNAQISQAKGNMSPIAHGLSAALANNMQAQKIAGVGGLEAQMGMELLDRGATWDQQKNSTLGALLRGDYTGAEAGLANLAALPAQLRSADLRNSSLEQALVLDGLMAPGRLKALDLDNLMQEENLAGLRRAAQMEGQTMNAFIEAKLAAAKAAAAQGRLQQWEAENAGWLGAAGFVGELLKSVAAGAAKAGAASMGAA